MGTENLTIRGINRDIWRKWRAKCILLGVPVGQRLNYLLTQDMNIKASIDDVLAHAMEKK